MEIIGNYPKGIPRKRTGLYSLDLAVRNKSYVGYPCRTITEVYGYPGVGKSTLSYYLAPILSEGLDIAICDLEQLDTDYILTTMTNAGYDGKVRLSDTFNDKGVPVKHEKMLKQMINRLHEETTGAAIWDSVGAVQPEVEFSADDFGEAFMGKRAKLVAQISRALSSVLRNKQHPSVVFVINHVHGIMGGKGHSTPGGDTLKHEASVRIMLYPDTKWILDANDNESEVLGFQVAGKVEKLRFGGMGRKFGFFTIPSYGVHVGASAMFDCFSLGLAEQGTTVKIDGKSLGYIRKDLLKYASEGKERKFEPFLEAIERYNEKQEKEMYDGEESGHSDGREGQDDNQGVDNGAVETGGSHPKVRGRKRKGGA